MSTASQIHIKPSIQVAVGVLMNAQQQVLVALRPAHVPFGGLWEFPGGKIELGETPAQALAREFQEEIGIIVTQAKPWFRTRHTYPERQVELHVWRIFAYQGEAHGREGQALQWLAPQQLSELIVPAANYPVISVVQALL